MFFSRKTIEYKHSLLQHPCFAKTKIENCWYILTNVPFHTGPKYVEDPVQDKCMVQSIDLLNSNLKTLRTILSLKKINDGSAYRASNRLFSIAAKRWRWERFTSLMSTGPWKLESLVLRQVKKQNHEKNSCISS